MSVEQVRVTRTGFGVDSPGPIIGEYIADFTIDFGLIALLGTKKTINIPGLKVSDFPIVNCVSNASASLIIGNTRVSAADTLEITFGTGITIGLNLGVQTFRMVAFQTS